MPPRHLNDEYQVTPKDNLPDRFRIMYSAFDPSLGIDFSPFVGVETSLFSSVSPPLMPRFPLVDASMLMEASEWPDPSLGFHLFIPPGQSPSERNPLEEESVRDTLHYFVNLSNEKHSPLSWKSNSGKLVGAWIQLENVNGEGFHIFKVMELNPAQSTHKLQSIAFPDIHGFVDLTKCSSYQLRQQGPELQLEAAVSDVMPSVNVEAKIPVHTDVSDEMNGESQTVHSPVSDEMNVGAQTVGSPVSDEMPSGSVPQDPAESLEQKAANEKSAKERYLKYHKALETLSSRVQSFWRTHPVERLETIHDESLNDGQIQPPPPAPKNAAKLADPFEWATCDLQKEESCSEVAQLLMEVDDEIDGMCTYTYTSEFLRWALRTPGFFQGWHLGVRDKSSSKLVAFIGGFPAKIKVNNEVVDMAYVKLFSFSKQSRSRGLSQAMIKEFSRRAILKKYSQAVFTSGAILPTPLTAIKLRGRLLNPQNFKDSTLSCFLPEGLTMKDAMKRYKLPDAPSPGFRKMIKTDVSGVTKFLQRYITQFQVAREFTEKEVDHLLLPRDGVVDSYVVVKTKQEDESKQEVTGLISFYTQPLTIVNKKQKNKTVNAAFSYYVAATETSSLSQLIKDALTVAKKTCHVFYASNEMMMMDSDSLFQDLKFEVDGPTRYVYLYNRRLRSGVKASQLAIGVN